MSRNFSNLRNMDIEVRKNGLKHGRRNCKDQLKPGDRIFWKTPEKNVNHKFDKGGEVIAVKDYGKIRALKKLNFPNSNIFGHYFSYYYTLL